MNRHQKLQSPMRGSWNRWRAIDLKDLTCSDSNDERLEVAVKMFSCMICSKSKCIPEVESERERGRVSMQIKAGNQGIERISTYMADWAICTAARSLHKYILYILGP